MSRKDSEIEFRRRHILDRARELILSKGVRETSMEEIARAADYTRRTLYSYFRSRDEIFLLVFKASLEQGWAAQRNAMAEAENGLNKVMAWGHAYHEVALEQPRLLQLMVYLDYQGIDPAHFAPESLESIRLLNEEVRAGLSAAFRLGIEDGSLRSDLDIDLCMSQYATSLRSVLHRALVTCPPWLDVDADEQVRHFLDLYSHAIRNPEGSPS